MQTEGGAAGKVRAGASARRAPGAGRALVEVSGAPRDADGLLEGDAHVGDVVGVEEAAELAVSEAEGEQVGDERLGATVVGKRQGRSVEGETVRVMG